jgi:uncharacterized repeat protein (TIGR03847 family)
MTVVHSYDPPERFVAGTVGPPGQRTFFLQARTGTRVTSVALEKQQVSVLAERIDQLLDDLIGNTEATVPAAPPRDLEDNGPLEQPIVEEFRAGTMTLAWDADSERVVVEVFPVSDAEPDADPESELEIVVEEEVTYDEMLVVRIPPRVARAFSKRALEVVNAGRPPCPFCGGPLDPSGHLCPRANGYRRTQP